MSKNKTNKTYTQNIDLIAKNTMSLGMQILCMALGYAVGAFPTAWLFTRARGNAVEKTPITQDRPISALWQRTNIEWTSILVMCIDAAKGALVVQLGVSIHSGTFLAPALAGFFAVLGHNYNIFAKARHGGGLPVAAGVMTALNPVPVLVFILCWFTGYFVIRRNYYIGLMTAVFATPVLMYTAPELLVRTFMRVALEDVRLFSVFVVILAIQIFVRYLEQMRTVFNSSGSEEAANEAANNDTSSSSDSSSH